MRIISFRAKSEETAPPPVLRVAGRELPVIVMRNARAKGYRLRYDTARAELRLSIPARGRLRNALDWAATQEEWIGAQLAKAPALVRMVPGAVVPVEGLERVVFWDRTAPRKPHLQDARIVLGGPEETVAPRLIRWLKALALERLRTETYDMAEGAGLTVASVSVGDPRGRWGSCAASGAIRYSWRLIFAPPEVRRAIVAHEVAHRLHMDHSPAFHAAHKDILGEDPAPARQWLRKHGSALHRFTG